MQSRVFSRLDHETRSRHALADEDRLCLMTSEPTLEAYRGFLACVYGFEAPVEAAIQMNPGMREAVDVRGRGHIKLLASDLVALGVSNVDRVPRCPNVFLFDSVEDALGWAYVIERNMLLDGILRRHLEKKLPQQLARAGAYLAGNERAVGVRMRELGTALDDRATIPGSVDRIVVAAHAAFRCQSQWLAEVVSPRAQVA